ncbi:ORF6N domain-containing protein [Candidatus Peregrinibacteria bacterium]|nr:ORF6N domain-containing protein [Candidatus Peregrinibacteria bacterium]
MSGKNIVSLEHIESKIYTINGVQVMLDEDLAGLYGVETRVLNQAVKRNIERFPRSFCFQLTESNLENLKSQIVTSSWGGRRTLPYAFTEQGVAMLSAVLKSERAVKMSIQIMNAFVAMRRFLSTNAQVFQRLDSMEIKQIQTDKKLDRVLDVIESRDIQPKQGIFYDGQVFDAYVFINDLIKSAKKSIVLIDNYIDESVLVLFSARKQGIPLNILTETISKKLELDVKKHNEQYPPLTVKAFYKAHDRFLIIDGKTVYHFGASLKDLGKKWFAFSKMDISTADMLKEAGEMV